MKHSIATPFITLLLSIAILPTTVQAQTTSETSTSLNSDSTHLPSVNYRPSPFNLANLAYRGYFKDQGIPSAGGLISALEFGTVTAQDIMQAAIRANKLPDQTLSDQGYRHNLENQLQALAVDN
jgi:hypothetical protein